MCEAEAREVSEAEIARGWQAPDGRMVVLEDQDLDHLPLATRKAVHTLGFTDAGEVDPLLYDRPYYAAPNGEVAQRPYALLAEALARTGRVGVAKFAVRTRERPAVLYPRRGVLVVHALRWPQEVRDPGGMAARASVTGRELQLAEALIEQLTGADVAGLHDEYGAALEQVVTAKLEGAGWAEPAEPEPAVDLMQALQDTIRQARQCEP